MPCWGQARLAGILENTNALMSGQKQLVLSSYHEHCDRFVNAYSPKSTPLIRSQRLAGKCMNPKAPGILLSLEICRLQGTL